MYIAIIVFGEAKIIISWLAVGKHDYFSRFYQNKIFEILF